MNTRHIVGGMLAVSVLLAGVSAFAKDGQTSAKVGKTPSPAVVSCVAAAVSAREAALGTGVANHSSAISDAYSARAKSLADAYTKTTGADIQLGVKSAWMTFNASTKAATKAWNTAKTSAWSTFRTAAKACKDTSGVTDTTNASSEVSGN